ncbi:hypothetical protein KMW28_25280 [Flammeovirga yaeyamensis]|uniref:Uncharacterized protein n=1 Tax=Flammeovirga yaeyamensis TaxID=367791 RepID=A0AAX1NEE8_9BACT|nr:hypothetical protein [Flammeovirga yaeyamensis]MBB3699393.1 hypothetical protein [Flammeovirga yaeyamensis]NMF35348.1 hypothetical protein [Flammeovirga yaeyamensis]QWG04208.1 hypothetical protein KMW28_25280 [Flammeovirga yaeyamensis]
MKELKLQLIDNAYNAEESKELLISILDHKIQFLNKKIFERFLKGNTGGEDLEGRVEELKAEKQQLIQSLNQYKDSDAIFEVDCHVTVARRELAEV